MWLCLIFKIRSVDFCKRLIYLPFVWINLIVISSFIIFQNENFLLISRDSHLRGFVLKTRLVFFHQSREYDKCRQDIDDDFWVKISPVCRICKNLSGFTKINNNYYRLLIDVIAKYIYPKIIVKLLSKLTLLCRLEIFVLSRSL